MKKKYVSPRVEVFRIGGMWTSLLTNFSGKGGIEDYEESVGFDGDTTTP